MSSVESMDVRTEIETTGVATMYRVLVNNTVVWSHIEGTEPEPGALDLFRAIDSAQRSYLCPTCGQLVFESESEHTPVCQRTTN